MDSRKKQDSLLEKKELKTMKPLPYSGWLNKDTKIKSVTMNSKLGILDTHQVKGEDETVYYITQHSDTRKIFLMCSEGLWEWIFKKLSWNHKNINPLPINIQLDEDTRLESFFFNSRPGTFELHYGRGDRALYVTKHGDPSKIFMVCTEEIWNWIFESE